MDTDKLLEYLEPYGVNVQYVRPYEEWHVNINSDANEGATKRFRQEHPTQRHHNLRIALKRMKRLVGTPKQSNVTTPLIKED